MLNLVLGSTDAIGRPRLNHDPLPLPPFSSLHSLPLQRLRTLQKPHLLYPILLRFLDLQIQLLCMHSRSIWCQLWKGIKWSHEKPTSAVARKRKLSWVRVRPLRTHPLLMCYLQFSLSSLPCSKLSQLHFHTPQLFTLPISPDPNTGWLGALPR